MVFTHPNVYIHTVIFNLILIFFTFFLFHISTTHTNTHKWKYIFHKCKFFCASFVVAKFFYNKAAHSKHARPPPSLWRTEKVWNNFSLCNVQQIKCMLCDIPLEISWNFTSWSPRLGQSTTAAHIATATHTYKHKRLRKRIRVCDYGRANAGKYCSKSSKLHQSKRKLWAE